MKYDKPEVKFWTDLDLYLDPSAIKRGFFTLKKNILVTDSGFFLEALDTKVIYKFHSYRESTSSANDEDLMELRILIDTEVNYVHRSYIKLWDLAANTGGIFKLLTTLFYVLSLNIIRVTYYQGIEKELVSIRDKKTNIQKLRNVIQNNTSKQKFRIDVILIIY
jgi:hypothetical protein